MWINNKPITTTGISQVTNGIKIQGKKEAAYEPVISKFSQLKLVCSNRDIPEWGLIIDQTTENGIKALKVFE